MIIWTVLILLFLGSIVSFIYFFLRHSFGSVKEGTARAIMSFGQFHSFKMVWRDHFMDENFTVLREGHDEAVGAVRKKITGRIFGGLFYFGLFPFKKTYTYSISWSDKHGRKEGIKGAKEEFNEVKLKPEVYSSEIENAETKRPERFQVRVKYLVTLKIENPYLFLFVSPENSLEEALSQIDGVMRSFVSSYSFEDLYKLKSAKIWEYLKESKLLREEGGTLRKWGVKIAEEGVTFLDISPMDEEISKALASEQKQEFKAKARSGEIAKTVVYMMAEAYGKTPRQVAKEIREDPEMKEVFARWAREMIKKKLAMENGSYVNIDVEGGGSLEKSFLNTIAGFLRMPQGKNIQEEDKKREKEEQQKIEKVEKEKESRQKIDDDDDDDDDDDEDADHGKKKYKPKTKLSWKRRLKFFY